MELTGSWVQAVGQELEARRRWTTAGGLERVGKNSWADVDRLVGWDWWTKGGALGVMGYRCCAGAGG